MCRFQYRYRSSFALLSCIVCSAIAQTQDGEVQQPSSTVVATSSTTTTFTLEQAGVQDQADAGPVLVVRVNALRVIPWKSYRVMRTALAAYGKYKSLAPDSLFSFAVLPPEGKTFPANFQLRLRTQAGDEYPIKLEQNTLFQLPVLPDPNVDADLVSNLKGEPLRIALLLHTPSVPPEKERLGDIRLRYEIGRAIGNAEHPENEAKCRSTKNEEACKPAHPNVWFKPRAPASGAWLVTGKGREPLTSNGDPNYASFRIPVNADHLNNDVVIEFSYKNLPGAVQQTVVLIYDGSKPQ